jgi:TolB-like protein
VAEVKEVRRRLAGPAGAIESLAALPLANEGADPEAEYLADGIPESLINHLSRLTHLRVMSRNTVFRYRARHAQDWPPDVPEVGRALGVRAVLTGRVAPQGDGLTVSVELADARDGSHLWGERYRRRLADLSTMPEAISREIAEHLRLTGQEERQLAQRHTESAEAYRLYLKGRYHWNKLTLEGVQKGVGYFRQAMDLDPHYALACVGLLDCYTYLGAQAEARQAAVRALEVDETLGEAHASLAFFRFLYDWDWAESEREFRRALELNPNYAQAHHWYAIYLANLGRHEEALREAQWAQELDPLSPLISLTSGLALYLARRYEEAVAEIEKTLELDSTFLPAHNLIGAVYAQQGRYDQAVAEYLKVMETLGDTVMARAAVKASIGYIYAVAGRSGEAAQILDELLPQPEVTPYSIAEVYAGLGEPDPAFAWLEQAYEGRHIQLVSLRAAPTLDRLRPDRRFAELLQRLGLAP